VCRDLPLTEALDYLSAIAIVFHGVLLSVARVLGPRRLYAVGPLSTLVVGGCFAAHCRYMLLVKFDYGWNMKLCVALGVAQSLLWMVREASLTQLSRPAWLLRVAYVGAVRRGV